MITTWLWREHHCQLDEEHIIVDYFCFFISLTYLFTSHYQYFHFFVSLRWDCFHRSQARDVEFPRKEAREILHGWVAQYCTLDCLSAHDLLLLSSISHSHYPYPNPDPNPPTPYWNQLSGSPLAARSFSSYRRGCPNSSPPLPQVTLPPTRPTPNINCHCLLFPCRDKLCGGRVSCWIVLSLRGRLLATGGLRSDPTRDEPCGQAERWALAIIVEQRRLSGCDNLSCAGGSINEV